MRNLRLILFVLLCAAPLWAQGPPAEVSSVPITYLPGSEDGLIRGHLFWVPVKVNGQECKFILDTGIGLNLVSQKLAGKLGCPETGETFEGQRMSGQTVEVPLSWYSQLSLGSVEREFVTCGVLDFEGFLPRTGPFEGIALSPDAVELGKGVCACGEDDPGSSDAGEGGAEEVLCGREEQREGNVCGGCGREREWDTGSDRGAEFR